MKRGHRGMRPTVGPSYRYKTIWSSGDPTIDAKRLEEALAQGWERWKASKSNLGEGLLDHELRESVARPPGRRA